MIFVHSSLTLAESGDVAGLLVSLSRDGRSEKHRIAEGLNRVCSSERAAWRPIGNAVLSVLTVQYDAKDRISR
jgi:hypothetical protein